MTLEITSCLFAWELGMPSCFQSDPRQSAFPAVAALGTSGWLFCPAQPIPASLLQGWVRVLQRSWALLPNGNRCWKDPGV